MQIIMGQKKTTMKDGAIPTFRGKKKQFYDALMNTREQFMLQMEFHSSEALISNVNAGEIGMSTHMADLGSDNALHDMELSMISNESDVLELIDEAIERLFNGSYGVCLDCSAKITDERLKAKPYARFCINCKSIREQNGGFNPEHD